MGERETVNDEEVRPKEFEDIWRDRGQKPGWQACGRNARGRRVELVASIMVNQAEGDERERVACIRHRARLWRAM